MNDSVFLSCLEFSLQGQAIINDKGVFQFVNQAFCEQFGYSKQEILLLSLASFIIEPPYNEQNEELFFYKGMPQMQTEKAILHGNGYLQSVLFTISDISTENDCFFHVQLDKLMTGNSGLYTLLEESIHKRNEVRLPKQILDGIKDAIMTIRLDGQFLYVNEEAEKMLNKKREELLTSDFWMYLKQDENKGLSEKIFHLLVGEEYTQLEYYQRNKNKWFDVRAYRSDDQVTLYFIDITLRKKMEKELKENELSYRSLVEHTPETITVHDVSKIIYVNPAGKKLFGFSDDEIEFGAKLTNFFSKTDQARARENMRLLISNKKDLVNAIYMLKTSSGKEIEVEATTTRIMFRGKPAFRTIIKDLSERKQVDDLMRKSDKLSVVAQLAAGVAHEIRNPLTTVKGFLQLFQKEQNYNDFYVKLVMSELERVESIIYEFLTLAKPNFESVFTEIDLYQLLHQILTLTKAQSNMNSITIDLEVEEVPSIMGLEKQLKQVLINLIRNSIEAVEDSGEITIRLLNHPGNQICIQVEDNGCGIPQERIERLGEPFYSTKEKGTGLGLMVCYKIIEHHNGVLNIYSEVGKGTKMEMILPLQHTQTPLQ